MRIRPLAAFLLLIASVASAEDLSKYSVVKVALGANSVDFSSDGKDDLVVVGRRENFNAHGFDVASFYMKSQEDDFSPGDWNILPLEDGSKEERLNVISSGGADCLLHDFRLLKGKEKNDVLLVLADRELGNSYVATETVTFSFYALKINKDAQIGSPDFYFEKTSSRAAKVKYCDVDQAFKTELGLGALRPSEE